MAESVLVITLLFFHFYKHFFLFFIYLISIMRFSLSTHEEVRNLSHILLLIWHMEV